MANHKSGAERYNDRMNKIFEDARRLERQRLERGEMPNPSLTSPEDARKYGWAIVGREVVRVPCKTCGHSKGMHSVPDKISACVVTDSEGPCMCQNFLC